MRSRFASTCHHLPISEPCASLVCPARFILPPFLRRFSRFPVSRYSSGDARECSRGSINSRLAGWKKRRNTWRFPLDHFRRERARADSDPFRMPERSRARLLSAPDDDYSSRGVWTDRVLFPPPSPPRAIVTTTFRADARSRTYHSAPRRVT